MSLIVGKAFVSDGNTIEIKGQRIKLFGVDAPDRGQTCVNKKGGAYPCGLRAAFALDRLAKGKTIYCEPRGVDNEKRVIAACSMAGLDLSGAMVETGWAIADLRYTDAYVEIETVARDAGLGLWAGDFDDPAQWRRAKKAAVTAPPTN